MKATSQLNSGRVVGRFIYTSRGTQGWGVVDLVGTAPDEVVAEALSHVERLVEQTSPLAPPVENRARRMVWGGTHGSPWRFLFQTVSAGDDASRRPHNNVTDCLVVRQQETGPLGLEPARLWSSTGWLTPYGPDEVTRIDLAALGEAEFALPVEDHENPLAMLAVAAATNNEPSLLHNVASLVASIANGAGGPGRSTLLALVDDVEFAPIFLSAATSVVPFDVAWNLPLEVRSVGLGSTPPDGSGIVAMGREYLGDVDGLEILDLGGGAAAPPPVSRNRCQVCDEQVETWGSLVSQCLNGLAAAAARPESDPQWVSGLAESLVGLVSDAGSTRVASNNLVGLFSKAALTSAGRLELAQLFDAETAWRLLERDHTHPPKRPIVIKPLLPTRPAARPPAPPKWPPARDLLVDSMVRIRSTLDYLALARPTEHTYWVAKWAVDEHEELKTNWYAEVHLLLGMPEATPWKRIESFSELDELYEGGFVISGSPTAAGRRLAAYCIDGLLRDLCSASVDDKHRRLDLREEITSNRIAHFAKSVPDPTWPSALLGPRVRNFIHYWLDEKPRRGYPSGLLASRGGESSLGYLLLSQAIELGENPLELIFVRESLEEQLKRGMRNEQFAGSTRRLLSNIDRRLSVLAPNPPPSLGGQHA